MDRNQAKKLLPIIQAHAEGKTIQSRYIKGDKSLWYDDEDPSFDDDFEYRIKPEPEYRPFANAEECWQEMGRHQPFGWAKNKDTKSFFLCKVVGKFTSIGVENNPYTYDDAFEFYTFADGTPFGVKEEK